MYAIQQRIYKKGHVFICTHMLAFAFRACFTSSGSQKLTTRNENERLPVALSPLVTVNTALTFYHGTYFVHKRTILNLLVIDLLKNSVGYMFGVLV